MPPGSMDVLSLSYTALLYFMTFFATSFQSFISMQKQPQGKTETSKHDTSAFYHPSTGK